MQPIICESREQTQAVARRLAILLRPGDVILLVGPLGCGKTTFTAALGEALAIGRPITSPSFVLMRSYAEGLLPLVHVDVYRLSSIAEFEELGCLEEGKDGVVVIEWGDAIAGHLADDHLQITFDLGANEERILSFAPTGSWVHRQWAEMQS